MFNFEEANKLLEDKDHEEISELIFTASENHMSAEKALEVISSKIDIQSLVKQTEGYQISNVEQATQALSMALQARKLTTALIESKKEITRPQLDFQRAVNKLVADYTQKLQEIEDNLKEKIEGWIDSSTGQGFTSGLDSIQVADGSLKRVNTWEFEVEDSVQIPFEYMCPDLEAIDKAIKGGIRSIPGVRIYMKQEIKFRVKN